MVHQFYNWLFAIPEGHRTISSVIFWWEKRRIPYNAIIGICGMLSLVLFYKLTDMSGRFEAGEDAVEPLALLVTPFVINFCYTGGWIVELAVKTLRPGYKLNLAPMLLKMGIVFSLIIVSLPTLIWGVIVLLQFLHLIK
jgi:hypothetical protein